MNVLLLLLVALAVLLMSHRFWGRMLGAVVFPPWPPSRAAGARGAVAVDIAASGGALSLVGSGLALAWGWAPVYTWILIACAFGAGLTRTALHWLAAVSGEQTGIGGIERICGTGLAAVARVALLAALLVWLAVATLMLAALLVDHPAAAATLLIQAVLALLLHRWLGEAMGAAGAGVVLLAGVAAVPAGVAVARALHDGLPGGSVAASWAAAGGVILAAVALAGAPRRRMLAPLSVLVAVALVILMLLASTAVVIEHPAAGFLGYFRADGQVGAIPLVAACAGVGILPLLGAVAPEPPQPGAGSPVAGATFEGLLASVLLAALLCAPVLRPGAPVELPDWHGGIEPGSVAAYGVSSLAVLGERLPIAPPLVADAVASVLAGGLAMLLVVGVGTLGRLVTELAPRAGRESGRGVNLAGIGLLAAAAALTLWHGTLPVDAWLFAGQLSLLFAATVAGTAAIAAARLRQGGLTVGAWALVLAVLFWWICVQQLVAAAADGPSSLMVFQVVAAALGVYGTAATGSAIVRLAGARQAT